MLSKGILGGLATHITISIGSLVHAATSSTIHKSSLQSHSSSSWGDEVIIAQKVIDSIYDECHVGPIEFIDEELIFEDPAALCTSRKEVQNAFFLLQYISPVKKSRIVYDVRDNDEIRNNKMITVVLEQYQQYTIGRDLILRSHVLVDVDVRKQKVVRIEERWNGNKLPRIGYPSRVINGFVSNIFTDAFLAMTSIASSQSKK